LPISERRPFTASSPASSLGFVHPTWGSCPSQGNPLHMQQNQNLPVADIEEDFAAMFEASLKERGGDGLLKEGEIIKGTVVQVTKDFAIVDIGYKSEGQIPISEFANPRGEIAVQEG